MKPSENCVALIKHFEKFEPRAYRCPAGKLTIGYGHVIHASEHHLRDAVLSEAQASALLAADLAKFAPQVESLLKGVVTAPGQFDALVSFAFNCGMGALRGSTLLKKLRAGDVIGAAGEFKRWNKSNGKVLAGLTRRRSAEERMFTVG